MLFYENIFIFWGEGVILFNNGINTKAHETLSYIHIHTPSSLAFYSHVIPNFFSDKS